jgi:hypothetical protein
MLHLLVWIPVAFLLALWTLSAWGLHVLFGLDPAWVGDAGRAIQQIPFGPTLDAWLPGWQAMLEAFGGATQALLGALGGVAIVVVWATWAFGALLLVGAGIAGSVLLAFFSRRRGGPPSAAMPMRG